MKKVIKITRTRKGKLAEASLSITALYQLFAKKWYLLKSEPYISLSITFILCFVFFSLIFIPFFDLKKHKKMKIAFLLGLFLSIFLFLFLYLKAYNQSQNMLDIGNGLLKAKNESIFNRIF